jgi:hypothetical protein
MLGVRLWRLAIGPRENDHVLEVGGGSGRIGGCMNSMYELSNVSSSLTFLHRRCLLFHFTISPLSRLASLISWQCTFNMRRHPSVGHSIS